MLTILFADDEERMRRLVKDFLQRDGYAVLEAADGKQAIELFDENKKIDLVILDVMMPKYDGWSVLRHIRNNDKDLPVMMLTARTEDSDEVFGIDLGADDYIGKPFSPIVLMARIKLLLRKRYENITQAVKELGGIKIDETARRVIMNDERLDLSPKEYELLVYLATNRDVAVSREQILNAVWGYDYFGDLRTVDTHIKKLRSKLGAKADLIQTVRGYGYRFEE
ncbi:MAG: response regulator transcription factor [Clostridia bacterium]|nr:response regulator transcription factor [Clostridia bacterium]MDD4798237.1 response regulator transcription factor [Clostridia bacterium]